MPRIGSEEDYEQNRGEGFSLLGEDDYLVEVKEFTIKADQPNPYDRTDEFPNGKPRDTAFVKLAVISFATGDPLFDIDGKDASDRLLFDFLEIEKMGFSGSGKPSKARKFVAACLGQDVRQAIEFDDWGVMVGKRLIAHGMVKKNGKNGVDDYRPLRRRPGQSSAATPAAAPVALPGESIAKAPAAPAPAEDVDVAAKAAELFGEEATF